VEIMDNRITNYIESLRKYLTGLPDQEASEAVSFYTEYLNEALEAGKDLDKVIGELDSPEKIAGMIKTETSIIRAQHSPGFRNFANALRNAFKSVSTPLSIFLLAIVEFVSYSMVAIFFGGAFACGIGGAAAFLTFAYEGIRTPFNFWLEKLGSFGAALFTMSLLMLAAVYLYRCGKLFIKFSTNLVRSVLKKSTKPMPEMEKKKETSLRKKRIVPSLLVIMAAGIILFGISGIPWKIYVITNSMKPEGMMKNIVLEYDPSSVNRISAVTANSVIRIIQGEGDKVLITYKEPEWMDYSVDNNGGMLTFHEKSSGMLPLFSLISLHEGMTELTISLPKGCNPNSVSLESTGGHIFISAQAENIDAKTLNGNINCDMNGSENAYDVKASTKKGSIVVDGTESGIKADDTVEYYKGMQSGKKIDLTSTNGSISIK
jgi:uncharacterized membrane protein